MATSRFAKIDTATLGDNTIVAALSGCKVRLLSYELTSAGAQTVTWKDGAATTLTGAMSVITGVPLGRSAGPLVPGGQCSLMETTAGNALILALSANTQVSGHATYVYEKV